MSAPAHLLAAAVLDALPQTQCRRCGYADCAAYAQAIAHEGAPIKITKIGRASCRERV